MGDQKFEFKKFVSGLNLLDVVGWAKAFVMTFRVAIIAALIAGGIFGYGYWKGLKNRPVTVNWEDGTRIELVNGDNKVHVLEKKGGKLYFDGRTVKVGDIPSLKPYGIGLHPKLAAGVTTSGNPAAGLALEVAHAYNFNLDILALYQFLGVGVSYDIRLNTPVTIDNTSIGLGIGRDFAEDENAAILYMAIEF